MVDSPGLSQSHELAWILRILTIDREVAMVHLVDNQICRRFCDRTLITAPVLRIGAGHIDDGATLTVGTYGLGKDTRALALTHVEGVELSHQVALDGGCPAFVASLLHFYAFDGLAA